MAHLLTSDIIYLICLEINNVKIINKFRLASPHTYNIINNMTLKEIRVETSLLNYVKNKEYYKQFAAEIVYPNRKTLRYLKKDIEILKECKDVDIMDLTDCDSLVDISVLDGIRTIILKNCQNIKSVNCIQNSAILYLQNCYLITDVSKLGMGKLKKLFLINCIRVNNFENLHNINYMLHIEKSNISDVSQMTHIRNLSLTDCKYIKEFNNARNKFLNIKFCSINNLNNPKVDTLSLDDCHNLDSIYNLECEEICILKCNNLTNITLSPNVNIKVAVLGYLQNFSKFNLFIPYDTYMIINCDQLITLKDLEYITLKKLQIYDCINLIDISSIKTIRVKELKLYNIHISDISSLYNIKNVCITSCLNITDFSPLKNAEVLYITNCNIEDVYPLRRVKNVNFTNCKLLKDVSSLCNCDRLYLTDCDAIIDISYLKNVNNLILDRCIGVDDISELKDGSMQILSLTDMYKITDVSILKNTPLKNLTINNMKGITKLDFRNTKIESILITNCDNLTEVLYDNIKTINIYNCKNLNSISSMV